MKKYYRLILSILVWFGLILRLIDMILLGINEGNIRLALNVYFSYFTIESNFMVAILFTVLTVKSFQNKPLKYPVIKGAVTLYITITGLVYAILLAKIHHVEGITLISTYILHYIIPPLTLIDWFIFDQENSYKYHYLFTWLLFPLLYFVYILIRGIFMDVYPYPFIDVALYGYPHVLISALLLSIAFILFGLVFVTINKKIHK